MKFNKTFLIFGIVFVLLVSSVLAVATAPSSSDVLVEWRMENSGDTSGNSKDLTTISGATNESTGIIDYCYNFDGSDDYTNIDDAIISSYPFSVNSWAKLSDAASDGTIFSIADSSIDKRYFRIGTIGSKWAIERRDTAGAILITNGTTSTDWTMVTAVFTSATDVKLYINGVRTATSSLSYTLPAAYNRVKLGVIADSSPYLFWNGLIDEVLVLSSSLTTNEIDYLYNEGSPGSAQQYPFISSVGVESLETNILFEQSSSVDINSNTYQLIESQTFVPLNSSNSSISATIEVETLKDLDMQCKILINGVDYDTETNRSFDSASIGNLYLVSSPFMINSSVNYTASLYCRRTSINGRIRIDKSVGIASLFLSSTTGKEINYKYMNSNLEITSSSYQLLANTSFLTSNISSIGLSRNLVFDGQIGYNYEDAGTIELYSVVNGVTSPIFNRYGGAGTSGSGGNFNIVYNVSNETSVPILIYGKSTSSNGDVDVKLYIKEMILHVGESNSTSLNGTSLTSTSWATAKTITINNTHALGDLVVKSSASTISTSGDQTITYRLNLNGSLSPEYVRSISNTGSGVSILQYLFKDIGVGVFDAKLEYKVSSGNALISGGSMKAFISGNIVPTKNNFLVTAKNLWDDASITSFNVSVNDAVFFQSNSSGVAIITGVNPSNITLSATNYFNRTYLNHNTSLDLEAFLYQSVINISIIEQFSLNPISNWTLLNGTTVLVNTTGSSGLFYPSGGLNLENVILSSNMGSFSDRTLTGFNISVFDNRTITYYILPTEFNVTAINRVTDAVISNFTITYSSVNSSHSGELSTTTGSIVFGVINYDTYNITIYADGFAYYENNIETAINGNGNNEFSLYVTNTLNITFRNEIDNNLITTNVSIELISDILSYVNRTDTGNLFLDLLSPQTYTVRYSALGFDERFYYFTLSNRSYNEITLYLTNASFTNVTATVYDQNNNLLEGAIINYLKYDADTNSYILMGMAITNFEGVTPLPIVLDTEYYKFQIYYSNILRTTTIPSYVYEDEIIFRVILTDLIGQDFFDEQQISGDVSYNNDTGNAKFDFSSSDGLSYPFCLSVYESSLNNGKTLLNVTCSTVNSGTILIPLSVVNGTSYFLEGTVTRDNVLIVDSMYIYSNDYIPNKDLFLFVFLLLSVVFGLMGLYSLRMSFILTPLPLFFGSLMGVIPIHASITGGLVLLGIIFAGVINNG